MYIRFLFNLKVFLYIVNVLFLLFLGFVFYIDNNGFVISGNDLILI